MSSKALLDENRGATHEQIKHALAGNICRCTGYVQILESVEAARDHIAAQISNPIANQGGECHE